MSDDNNNDLPSGETDDQGNSDVDQKSLKDVLSETTGREYKDDQEALKSVKDTFDYVGKAGKVNKALEAVKQAKGFKTDEEAVQFIEKSIESQDNSQKIDTSKFVSREEFDRNQFYSDNDKFKPYQSVIENFAKANPGKTRQEVVELPEVKDVLTKLQTHDATEKKKSVLHSNQRIGTSTDKLQEAKDAQASGNQQEATQKAVEGVIDAFGV